MEFLIENASGMDCIIPQAEIPMSEHYKCNICGAPATVHLTQIVDGKIHKVHLCEKCAAKSKVAELPILKFTEMLAKTLAAGGKTASEETTADSAGREPNKICPVCGMTDVVFDKKRLFGCPHCYEIFSEEISALLPKIQRGRDYRGDAGTSVPAEKGAKKPGEKSLEAANLKLRLKEAVEKEDYALAAKLRDALRALEAPKKAPRKSAKKSPEKPAASKTAAKKSSAGTRSGVARRKKSSSGGGEK